MILLLFFQDSPIQINSRTNISLSAVDKDNKVQGQISLDSRKLIFKNNELHIQNMKGESIFYADDKKIKMNIDNLDITGQFLLFSDVYDYLFHGW